MTSELTGPSDAQKRGLDCCSSARRSKLRPQLVAHHEKEGSVEGSFSFQHVCQRGINLGQDTTGLEFLSVLTTTVPCFPLPRHRQILNAAALRAHRLRVQR